MIENYSSWAQRNGFSAWAIACIWIVIAFISFQFIGGVVFFAALVVKSLIYGVAEGAVTDLLAQNFGLLFIGNSVGQILVLALGTWLFCRLQVSSENRSAFLRFNINKKTVSFTVIALIAIVCIQPLVWFLGWLNALLPSPELFDSFQLQQMNALQSYIGNEENLLLFILFNVALVPAICEEILFRGYVLRSFQRSWGYIIAIIVSGFIFGMFHLQLTHLLPLAAIGMLLGYLSWVSESIIPAIAAHFLNNAGSIFLIRFFPNSEMANTSATVLPPIPFILLSIVVTAILLYVLYKMRVVQSAAD